MSKKENIHTGFLSILLQSMTNDDEENIDIFENFKLTLKGKKNVSSLNLFYSMCQLGIPRHVPETFNLLCAFNKAQRPQNSEVRKIIKN